MFLQLNEKGDDVMQVNEEVYGSKDKWSSLFTSTTIKEESIPKQSAFLASNGTYNSLLQTAFLSGVLSINNPIDDSIAFVGVDNGSWLTDRKWLAIGKVGDEYVAEYDVCKLKKKNSNPLAYFSTPSAGTNNDLPYVTNAYTSFWGYNQSYVSGSANMSVRPYTYISVKDMVYVAMVRVIDKNPETLQYSDSYTTKTFDLYTYFKHLHTDGKHIYEHYPYVISLFLIPVYSLKTKSSTNDYRVPTNNSSIGSAKPNIMTDFEDAVYPFDDTGKSLRILTYLQSGHSYNDNSFRTVRPFSDPTSSIYTDYTISYNPVYVAGQRNLWVSVSKTTNQMHCVYSNVKTKYYLDNTVWRIARWLTKVDDANSEETYAEYMKQCAYLGCFFTDSYDYAVKVPTWDYDRCHIGIIDDNGITHGEYSTGEKNREQKQWNWESFDENNYSPSKKPTGEDKEKPSTPYNYNSNLNVGLDGGNYYAMSKYELNAFKNWQHNVTNPAGPLVVGTPGEGEYSYELLGYNLQFRFNGVYPEGQILSLMYFPFLVDEEMKRHSTLIPNSYIQLGNYETWGTDDWFGSKIIPAKATKIDSGSNFVEMTSGEYPIEEYYGDFRDYSPYTSMSLIIPFHGTIELDPGTWYGHTINTRMVVDIITGASTTVIERDGIPVDTVQGQVGVPVNLIARNVGDYASKLISNSQSLNQQKFDNVKLGVKTVAKTASALGKGAVGIATKNIGLVGSAVGDLVSAGADVMSSREKYKNTEFQIEHNQADSTVVSSNAPSVAQYLEMFPRLVIRYPTLMAGFDSETYGKTVGYACNIQDTVGNFKGFTVFSGADLTGLSCQEDIKTRIFGLLQQGVIL